MRTWEWSMCVSICRVQSLRSSLGQDVAFYDKGKTGDVISRLSADVQSVSDSICLNTNILSRSALQVGACPAQH
eukprot:scaffold552393_cov42-Prasinocladus_malaysianus.AAC.2